MGAGLGGVVSGRLRAFRRERHLAALPRYTAIAALFLFLALGLRAAFFPAAATPVAAPAQSSTDAPSEDFALQFARAYLTYDAAHPGRRAQAMAPFVPEGLEGGAGAYAAHGVQRVLWEDVASDQPSLQGGRAITVAVAVSTQRLPLYLAVTVSHEHGGPLSLVGYPAFVGAPSVASTATVPQRETVSDRGLIEVVDRVLRNYLAGDARDLRADLSADAQVTLPTRRLRLREVQRLEWIGAVGSAAVLATVSASDEAGSSYTLAYELGIERRERPYVDFIEVIPTAS